MDAATWQSTAFHLEDSLRKTDAAAKTAIQIGNLSARRPEFKRKVASAREGDLAKLISSLDQYRENPRSYGLSSQDITVYATRLDNINSLIASIESSCRNDSMKSNLLADSSNQLRTTRHIEETDATKELNNRELLDQQLFQRVQEDEALDEISHGLFNLKQIGLTHSKQFDRQSGLLDELHEGVDTTQLKLDSNLTSVDKVEKATSGGWCTLIFMTVMLGLILSVIVSNWICVLLPNTKQRCK